MGPNWGRGRASFVRKVATSRNKVSKRLIRVNCARRESLAPTSVRMLAQPARLVTTARREPIIAQHVPWGNRPKRGRRHARHATRAQRTSTGAGVSAKKALSDCTEASDHGRVVWRCTLSARGALFVLTGSTTLLQTSYAGHWATRRTVSGQKHSGVAKGCRCDGRCCAVTTPLG